MAVCGIKVELNWWEIRAMNHVFILTEEHDIYENPASILKQLGGFSTIDKI